MIFISKGAEVIPDSYTLARIEHCLELDEEKKEEKPTLKESTFI